MPFRDQGDPADSIRGAFLRIIERDGAFFGGLLVVNGRAEPVEFVHSRLDLPATSLCPPAALPGYAAALLVRSLFETVNAVPELLIHYESETGPEIFAVRMKIGVPVVALDSAVPFASIGSVGPQQEDLGQLLEQFGPMERIIEIGERTAAGLSLVYK